MVAGILKSAIIAIAKFDVCDYMGRRSCRAVLADLKKLIAVRDDDYRACFSLLEHTYEITAPVRATLRLHYVRADASGEPVFDKLAWMLVKYITVYCFTVQKRRGLDELEHNELFMQARDLFRDTESSGQAGELLIYFLLETVLNAPQALKKMPITTNAKDERKGSDGLHLRWNEKDDLLELIFAESKLWASFSSALGDAFKSIEAFHSSRNKQHEVNAFTATFTLLEEDLRRRVISYVDGENIDRTRTVQACLIGFDWDEYKCLDDGRRAAFVSEFDSRYRLWAASAVAAITEHLKRCSQKQLTFEFFLLPFRDVAQFRQRFNQALGRS